MLKRTIACVAALALLGLAGCGDDEDDSGGSGSATTVAETTTPEPPASTAEATGTTIETSESQFGEILFDSSDQAIYLFDAEKTSKPECYGACAEAWPPVLTEGAPQPGNGIDAAKLGTAERRDGTTQVTYAGSPLYYYVDDPKGEVLCHNVEEFGGLWLVLQANGEPAPARGA